MSGIIIPGVNDKQPAPEAPVLVALEPCPKCGAKPEKRIDGTGFGAGPRITLCGACGFQF